MFNILKKNTLGATKTADIIEDSVYERLKPLGFCKFGRTLHRFVSGDISQVINFQIGPAKSGMNDRMWINIGIRVPECAERDLNTKELKKYYHEYECNIRSRLGETAGKGETEFFFKKSAEYLTKIIIAEIEKYVVPAFEVLNSRESILKYRKDFPNMDTFASAELDEVFIYLKLGNEDKAKELFENYYRKELEEYEHKKKHGQKVYLKKGQRIMAGESDITANKNGFYTVYAANNTHLKHLDELAKKFNLK